MALVVLAYTMFADCGKQKTGSVYFPKMRFFYFFTNELLAKIQNFNPLVRALSRRFFKLKDGAGLYSAPHILIFPFMGSQCYVYSAIPESDYLIGLRFKIHVGAMNVWSRMQSCSIFGEPSEFLAFHVRFEL